MLGLLGSALVAGCGGGRARVTFFVLGQKVGRRPDLVRRMVYEGHEVGNHTWSHPPMPTLSTSEMRSQVERTQEAVKGASGVRPRLFRPPYGTTDAKVARVVNMPQIAWDVDCMDWHPRNSHKRIEAGMKQARPGGIMLLHDVYPSTVTTVPNVVSTLRQRGFTLVTVSELFQYTRLQTEPLYRNLRW